MDTIIQRKFKWFWPWQDQQEEEWLRKMARSGLHLRTSDGIGRYTFEKATPADVVYRLDYNGSLQKDKEHYLQIFRDDGWEYAGEMNGWQYFRKPAGSERPAEIFTDAESKIQKYQRYLNTTFFWLPVCMMSIAFLNFDERPELSAIILGVFSLILLFFSVIAVKVYRRMDQLKKI